MSFSFQNIYKAISKNGFWLKVKAAVFIRPEEYIGYFEDLIKVANAEIEPKVVF